MVQIEFGVLNPNQKTSQVKYVQTDMSLWQLSLVAVVSLFIASQADTTTTTTPPTSTSVHNNYQLCFTLKDLRLYNLDYHSRKSVYATPSAQIHLFDPSLTHPSIRSFDLPLSMSSNPNITSYEYNNLNTKLCWINTLSTQLYFDFEIFQFYHVAMRVGYPLNTGLNGSGLEEKDFKLSNKLNMTSSRNGEYSGVLVSIHYSFELTLLTQKQYNALKDGSNTIEGSISSLVNSNNMLDSSVGDSEDFVEADNNEFSELSKSSNKHKHKNNKNEDSSSNNIGMIFSAVVAAMVGFGVLVGVVIYLLRMYSRKDYDDVDKEQKKREKRGNNKQEFYDEVKDGIKGKLKRISLRDTKNKFSKIKEKITTKASISLQTENPEKYETISDPNDNENGIGNDNGNGRERSITKSKECNSDDDSGSSIDVSIVTNESRGLP